tara:strand:+ start:376 stop:579 length:204 start_codon:yes stop_codon:yes gene_type:complete
LILNIHKLIIFYHPKFIKLKPAIKNIASQIKPLTKKKVKLPIKKYLPNLLFDKKFFNFDRIVMKKLV